MATRKPIVGGNWKSNPANKAAIDGLIEAFNAAGFDSDKVDVVICPTMIHALYTQGKLDGKFNIAAQNCSKVGEGAFTGEVTCGQLLDMGRLSRIMKLTNNAHSAFLKLGRKMSSAVVVRRGSGRRAMSHHNYSDEGMISQRHRIDNPKSVALYITIWGRDSKQIIDSVCFGSFREPVKKKTLPGINWTLIGHSERRHKYGETDADLCAKVEKAQAAGINVIFCIGELLEERKAGKTVDV